MVIRVIDIYYQLVTILGLGIMNHLLIQFIFPGPDICGYSTKKVHVIFNYKGKNHLIKKEIKCKVILAD